jgi:hypothetical protein
MLIYSVAVSLRPLFGSGIRGHLRLGLNLQYGAHDVIDVAECECPFLLVNILHDLYNFGIAQFLFFCHF